MKLCDISKNSDGTIICNYTNGFVFEGITDGSNNPASGIITSPDGTKYRIPNLQDYDILRLFAQIKAGKMRQYIIHDNGDIF